MRLYHIRQEEPISVQRTAALGVQKASLQTCMDHLGAPFTVWESPQGIALAYAWLDKTYWQFEIQAYIPDVDGSGQTVFQFENTADGFDGTVLIFDDKLELALVRHGKLGLITRDLRAPSTYIE